MGLISQSLQCIFVERTRDGGNNTSQKIRERLEAEPGIWPLLALAPEGTTTNGSLMIHFHTGAFRPGQPVLPMQQRCLLILLGDMIHRSVVLTSNYSFDVQFMGALLTHCPCQMNFHIIGLMSQPWNRLTVYELPVYDPSDDEKLDSQLFANNVRQQIANVLKIPVYELQWRDKLIYEPSAKKREIGRKLLLEANGGVMPPDPVFTQDVFGNPLSNAHKKDE